MCERARARARERGRGESARAREKREREREREMHTHNTHTHTHTQENGANVDAVTKMNDSCLHLAVTRCDVQVRFLLQVLSTIFFFYQLFFPPFLAACTWPLPGVTCRCKYFYYNICLHVRAGTDIFTAIFVYNFCLVFLFLFFIFFLFFF